MQQIFKEVMIMAKVLVVDDVAVDLNRMADIVKSMGHIVIQASDGDEAIAKTQSEKPDLILLDIVIPKKNGFQVCRELRDDPSVAATPIIMVTSKNQDNDKFYGLKQGANEYIPKPYTEDALKSAIAKFLK
jgi:twitching motility two-component system response regulator PilH